MKRFFSRIFRGEWEYEASFLVLSALIMIHLLEMAISRGNHPSIELLYFPVRFFLMFSPFLFFSFFIYRKFLKPNFEVKLSYRIFLKKLFFVGLRWLLLYFLFYLANALLIASGGAIYSGAGFWNDIAYEIFFMEVYTQSIAFLILMLIAGLEMVFLSVKNFRFLPAGVSLSAISCFLLPILLAD